MKFKASLSNFQNLLQKALPAIPPKSTLPVLEHLHFELTGNQLRITATDQDITIIADQEVTGTEDGTVLVPGRRLNDIVKALGTQGDFDFTANLDTYEIDLTTSNGQYGMKGLNKDEYLDIPELFSSSGPLIESAETDDTDDKATFAKGELMRLANKTAFAVSTDEFRPAMTGVLFQFRGNSVTAVATDSYRLCRAITRSEENKFPADLDVIIPGRSVELLKKVDDDVTMNIIRDGGKITHARFRFGKTIFVTRVIDERFPPYESVIPDNNDLIASVDQRQFLSAIRRVSIFTSSITKQVKIALDENNMTVAGKDDDIGTDGDESLTCDFSGEHFEIGFNYRFLEEALANIDPAPEKDYHVELMLSEPTRPALIRPKDINDELLMLIMPVRIN